MPDVRISEPTPSTASDAASGEASRRRPSRRSGLLLAAVSLLATLAALEILLRLFLPFPDPYAAFRRVPAEGRLGGTAYVPSAFAPRERRIMRAEPGLPGIDERPRTFSVNHLGYRGDSLATPKPAGEVRVFMVGGSTTECIFLDDAEAVTAVLQRRLAGAAPGARVYGAGKSGDRSYDHVAMVSHRIAHLQPDVVVVFAGINDLFAGMAGRDYLLRPAGEGGRELDGWMLARLAATRLHLPRLAHAALRGAPGRADRGLSAYRQAARRQAARPPADGPPRTDVPPYAENLATLAGIARAHGVRLVFMTQATTWNSRVDPRAREWHWATGPGVRHREEDLDAAMERYNDAMRAVGAAQGVPVFDLARALPKSLDYFYDDVHFNVAGADTAAALLARFMVEQGVVASSR